MKVHVICDSTPKLVRYQDIIEEYCDVSTQLIVGARSIDTDSDVILAVVNLGQAENIQALKALSEEFKRIPKRIFVLERSSRQAVMQSYALGATSVVTDAYNRSRLLFELFGQSNARVATSSVSTPGQQVAADAAGYVASMFNAAVSGSTIDIKGASNVGGEIVAAIAEHGLTSWLKTVRHHHEGTYQHCLLVTGIAADFGLSLSLRAQDIGRLTLAAVLHDVGKARIPPSILDKPGVLDHSERSLIETHPVAGFGMLKDNPNIAPEILDAVLHHHEYLDGSGYPDGLAAGSIADLTRILTISDIFAALIEHRTYKPSMSREAAYGVLQSMKGKLELPLVAAFKDVALAR